MVASDWNDQENKISIYFYFDKEITDDNRVSANSVAAEISGDFEKETEIIEKCIHLNFPIKLPSHTSTVYRRKE